MEGQNDEENMENDQIPNYEKNEYFTEQKFYCSVHVYQLEKQHQRPQKYHLRDINFENPYDFEYEQDDGSKVKTLIAIIRYKSLKHFRKVGDIVMKRLESHFKCPVFVVGNHKILSAKSQRNQEKPKNLTQADVDYSILEDICFPASIIYKYTINGKEHIQIKIDSLNKEKIEAISHIYKELTKKTI